MLGWLQYSTPHRLQEIVSNLRRNGLFSHMMPSYLTRFQLLSGRPGWLMEPHLRTRQQQVSIVAMSGAVGEALSYGTATGGASDLDNLGQIMNQTNPPMDGKEQQSQARQDGAVTRGWLWGEEKGVGGGLP